MSTPYGNEARRVHAPLYNNKTKYINCFAKSVLCICALVGDSAEVNYLVLQTRGHILYSQIYVFTDYELI